MSKSRSFASLAIGGAALLFAAGSANAASFGDFPNIGSNDAGAALLITLGPGGATISTNPTNSGPYDGVEDAYIGLWNNSSQTVNNITLSGVGIFGFDGDGIGGPDFGTFPVTGYGTCTSLPTECGTQQYGIPNASDNSGYGGPSGFFSNISGNTGVLNIIGGLAPGAFTWFSLEESPDAARFTITSINNTTPIPAALPLFAGGLGVLGLVARRRKRKTASAT